MFLWQYYQSLLKHNSIQIYLIMFYFSWTEVSKFDHDLTSYLIELHKFSHILLNEGIKRHQKSLLNLVFAKSKIPHRGKVANSPRVQVSNHLLKTRKEVLGKYFYNHTKDYFSLSSMLMVILLLLGSYLVQNTLSHSFLMACVMSTIIQNEWSTYKTQLYNNT